MLRYLKGTTDTGLMYRKPKEDADFASDLDNRRSLSGYLFLLGGNIISWKSTLQPVVALSTTEAEFITISEAG